MKEKSLEELLGSVVNPVSMLRNSHIGAYVYPVVPSEYSNWRDEQRAWPETAVLFDQSHHMANLYVEGPDALKMLSYLAINSFAKFPVNRAKQFAPCSYDGFVIGDGILFHLEESRLLFVGARAGGQLDSIPCRDRPLQPKDRKRRPLPFQSEGEGRDSNLLPLPDSGPQCDADS